MPRKDPKAYREYMREYMKKKYQTTEKQDLAARRAGLHAVGMAPAPAGEAKQRVEWHEVDERERADTREFSLSLPPVSPYWT